MHYLTLKDREEISSLLDNMDLHLSEFCFPNLYFFRKTHEYEIIRGKGTTYIGGLTYDQKRYIMPLHDSVNDPNTCEDFLVEQLKSGKFDMIFPVPETWLHNFPEDQFTREYKPEDSDYLYHTKKLVTLSGKKLQKKRNLISQFLREFDEPEIKELREENRKHAEEILKQWQLASPDEINVSDYCQCLEALGDIEGFGLQGALFYAKGEPAGFILGEPLNDETFTIHFAKGLTRFKGIYPLMFSRFSEHYLQDYTYMNMEQDLGKPGLRQTKRSYVPDLMGHKYRISL